MRAWFLLHFLPELNLSIHRVVSISLVFINKALLPSGKNDTSSLDAPLFVTWFQCVVTVIICYFLSYGAKVFPRLGKFPELVLDRQIMIKVSEHSRQPVET